jgi:hypothetical protein
MTDKTERPVFIIKLRPEAHVSDPYYAPEAGVEGPSGDGSGSNASATPCRKMINKTRATMNSRFTEWIAAARAVPLEQVIAERGIQLRRSGNERISPCPRCGGIDRFAINVVKRIWNCRGCKPADVTGDVIGLVEWLDGVGFLEACATLTGEERGQHHHVYK